MANVVVVKAMELAMVVMAVMVVIVVMVVLVLHESGSSSYTRS